MWVTCGLLWCFYQLFGLSFWRHPFTAEDPLVSKWCNATFLQIFSVEETKSSASWMAWGWVHFSYCSFISCNKHTIQEVGLLMLLLHNVVSVIVLSSPRLVLCVLNITFKLFVTCMCRTLTSTAARSIEPTSRQKTFHGWFSRYVIAACTVARFLKRFHVAWHFQMTNLNKNSAIDYLR